MAGSRGKVNNIVDTSKMQFRKVKFSEIIFNTMKSKAALKCKAILEEDGRKQMQSQNVIPCIER